MARECRIAATLTTSGTALEGSESGTISDDIDDGVSGGCGRVIAGGNSQKLRETMLVGEASAPTNRVGGKYEAATGAAVPHKLAMMLREELDVSYRVGCHAAGRRDERMEDYEGCGDRDAAGDGSSAGLLGTYE